MRHPYRIIEGSKPEVPILISIPHCGTLFPEELKDQYRQDLIADPDDTDWFVDRLYDFAPAIGITMITAVYSRWVIDLNRHPESKPLYADGRIITGLCPTTDFLGNNLYNENRREIERAEVQRRLNAYYWPYHYQLRSQLDILKKRFGKVLLWDCHSIRQIVPTIQKDKFPDLILGSADGVSASADLIESAIRDLTSDRYAFQHNHPFKGGYITREYGKPSENIHALQLEMTKVNYMRDDEKTFDEERAARMAQVLKRTLLHLAEIISS
jgi:N-formylglutamate deformylase